MRPRFFLILLVFFGGCRTTEKYAPWSAPILASPDYSPVTKDLTARWAGQDATSPAEIHVIHQARSAFVNHPHRDEAFALAELHYAAGARAEEAQSESCVDLFYQSAGFAYFALFGPASPPADAKGDERLREIYNSSLARLINDGQIHGRLDPKKRLMVQTPGGARTIPLVQQTGPWHLDDNDQLMVVGDYEPLEFKKRYGQSGLGVALVAVRNHRGDGTARDQFLFEKHPFALTAVLYPDLESLVGHQKVLTVAHHDSSEARLELYDSFRVRAIDISGRQVPLSADLSAPLQYSMDSSRQFQFDLIGFRKPDTVAKMSGLFLLEPYQPGKIPVVFVHGLLSDPDTWDELLNELRADPEFHERFQFAVYMYPTGNPFLVSAGHLRQSLQEMQKLNDPKDPDPALQNMVLIGHSMGGVLSRFQVTRSDDKVWEMFAHQPFEKLRAPADTRRMLHDSFFFEPQPFVKRVVFIGTPHKGSTLARNILARICSSLVTPPRAILQIRDQLLADNPGILNPTLAKQFPTSVEDLATGSPILDTMQTLPFNPQVHLHSIVGYGKFFPLLQPGDGFVPVSSAHLDGVESELFVKSEHMKIHKEPESVKEVKRILRLHLRDLEQKNQLKERS